MKLLILDSSNFSYKLHHRTPVGENIKEEQNNKDYNSSMIVFTTIEEFDSEKIIKKCAKDIRKIARKNKVDLVIINPFAHLSNNLASPNEAIEILNKLTLKLTECQDFKTERSVFGWYKEFTISVKGHENSQIYREYN